MKENFALYNAFLTAWERQKHWIRSQEGSACRLLVQLT